MRFLMVIGLCLVVLGIFALAFQGFSFFTHDQVAQVGPVSVNRTQEHTVWLPPVMGITALVVGGLLILMGRRPHEA